MAYARMVGARRGVVRFKSRLDRDAACAEVRLLAGLRDAALSVHRGTAPEGAWVGQQPRPS